MRRNREITVALTTEVTTAEGAVTTRMGTADIRTGSGDITIETMTAVVVVTIVIEITKTTTGDITINRITDTRWGPMVSCVHGTKSITAKMSSYV